ncbi:MAG TPA: proprotein convertase P-domain-containing protein [Kofleriaceae bacterium]|nr:proprotein convertase P-domain-containing protein [Kofleriaceae bacterium]
MALRLHVAALVIALWSAGAAGCGSGDPRACSVTCGAAGACPGGTECGGDLYCHLPAEIADSCLAGPIDAAPIDPVDGAQARIDAAEDRPDGGGRLRFTGEDAPALEVPDDDLLGIDTTIEADVPDLEIETVEVHLEIFHDWRGDMVLTLLSPDGESAAVVDILPDDSGLDVRGTFEVEGFTRGSRGDGTWTLHLEDRGPGDVGVLEYWSIGVNAPAP